VTQRPTHGTTAGQRYLALRRLARATGRPTSELLQLYALEGFLARLALSPLRDTLVLKGGMLLAAFDLRRATRDLDFLALLTDNDEAMVAGLVRTVAMVELDDGLDFAPDGIRSEMIRDEDIYPGVRARLEARLATARLVLHVDVDLGDPVIPSPSRTPIPTLLGGPRIEVLAYPKAMVVAEKLVTALQRGLANTRWRDFADLHLLLRVRDIDEADLVDALRVVAGHRQVSLVPLSTALQGMPDVAGARWEVWWRQQDHLTGVPESLAEVLDAVAALTDDLIHRARSDSNHGSTG